MTKGEKGMKKSIAWLIGLLMVLGCCAALAGGSLESGEYSVSALQTGTVCSGDVILRIDTDEMDQQSIDCSGKLTFTITGDHFLALDNGSGTAVQAAAIELKGVAVIWPEGGYIGASGGQQVIMNPDHTPAKKVILGPDTGWQAIVGSSVKTSELQKTKILILQHTTIRLDGQKFVEWIYDPLKMNTVTFVKDTGAKYLDIGNYTAAKPIEVGEVVIGDGLMIANPRGGKPQGGTVVGVSGNTAVSVVIARKGQYAIHSEGVFAETDYWSIDYADAGDLVWVRGDGPGYGRYMSAVESPDVTVNLEEDNYGKLQFSFTMPAKEVSVKGVYEAQIPYTFKLAGVTELPTGTEMGLLGSVTMLTYSLSNSSVVDGKTCFDLDKDGTVDLIETSVGHFSIAPTWSLGDKWESPQLYGEKFSPLTFDFTPEATTPAPTEPTAEPTPAPTNVTIGQLKYRLSGAKATVTGPKSRSAKRLTIPKTIRAGGKTYKVTEIKAGAFKGMKKLTSVTLGENIKTIGKSAFQNCGKLKNITIKTKKLTGSSVKSNAFKGIYKKAIFKCPKGKAKTYEKILRKRGAPKTAKFK